jgi:hypothetical protein
MGRWLANSGFPVRNAVQVRGRHSAHFCRWLATFSHVMTSTDMMDSGVGWLGLAAGCITHARSYQCVAPR